MTQTVSGTLISAFVVAAVLTTIIPVVLVIVLAAMKKVRILPLIIGAAAFFISQVVLRIPLLAAVAAQSWFTSLAGNLVLYVFVLSLSAGLFEESARLAGATILKKRRSFRDIISFGLGHGLCEVVIIVGMSHINNIVISLALNGNAAFAAMLTALSAETLEAIAAQLAAANALDVWLGVIERVASVFFHIFATMLVFRAVIQKKPVFYLLALLAHTAVNMIAVLSMQALGAIAAEVILMAIGITLIVYVFKQRDNPLYAEVSDAEGT